MILPRQLERVLKHFNFRLRTAATQTHCHDIEPARHVEQALPAQIVSRRRDEPTLLERRHRRRRGSVVVAPACLHLDEDERSTISGDDVDFSTPSPVPAGKNRVPSPLELAGGQIFANFPEPNACSRHRHSGLQFRGPRSFAS